MTKSKREENYDRDLRECIRRYEDMLLEGRKDYFDEDDLLDVADYYYNDMSRPADAMQCLDFLLTMHPLCVQAQLMKAEILFYSGQKTEAWSILNAVRSDRDPDVMYYYGLFSLEEGRKRDAAAYYSRAYFAQTGDALDMFVQIAWDYLEHCEVEGLDKWFAVIPDCYRNNTRVLEAMAEYYRQTGEFDQAVAVEQKLIDKDPYNVRYWTSLTKLYCQSDRYSDAIESVTYSLDIAPDDTEALMLAGEVFTHLNEWEKARDCYEKYISIDDRSANAYYDYAHVLVCLDKYQDALVQLKYAEKYCDGKSIRMLEIDQLFSSVYWAVGDYAKARRFLERSRKDGIPEWAYLLRRLSIDIKEGKKTRLTRPALKVAELMVSQRLPLDTLIFTLFSSRKMDLATKVMDETEKKSPKYASSFLPFRSATCFFEHKGDEFLRYLKEALKREPERTKAVFSSLFPDSLDLGGYYDYAEMLVSRDQYPEI